MTTPTLPPSALPPGFIVDGRYEVAAPLGSGGQGYVYEVFDHHMKENAALKLLPNVAPSDAWHEAELLTKVRGKYVLPVKNASHVQGLPYVVTEIARHGTADRYVVPPTTVDTATAIRWTLHASRGVARLHDLELVHNDLKPGNLFLDDHRDVLLGDLGYASLLDTSGMAALTGGTPATMAPEVAGAAIMSMNGGPPGRPCGVRTDVYSLGATLYWFLTGHPPYVGASHAAVCSAVVAAPPSRIRDTAPHVSQALGTVIEKSMARDPSMRYGSAAEFDYALARLSRADRSWERVGAHPGHSTCFEGTKGSSCLQVCVRPTGHRTRHMITVTHKRSGRTARVSEICTLSELPKRLRKVFREAT